MFPRHTGKFMEKTILLNLLATQLTRAELLCI